MLQNAGCMLSSFLLQIQVQHPAAKSMIEISRTQDEEVGDGTTSVIILGKSSECVIISILRRNTLSAGVTKANKV